jgi:hypothetical protein
MNLAHLRALTDDTGIIQHATADIPNRSTGYCTDDVARALMVAIDALRAPETAPDAERLVTVYLAFLHDAQLADGWFHNFLGYDRTWQDRRGSEDAVGRAIWGLGYALRYAPRPSWRAVARDLFARAMPHIAAFKHLRARAYAGLGLSHALSAEPTWFGLRSELAAAIAPILAGYAENAASDWRWCEPLMTYDNARLCEVLLRAGGLLDEPDVSRIGREMLDFYAGIVIEDGIFVPIGNDGWYPRGGARARFGQQPLEAAGMVAAGRVAHARTGASGYHALALTANAWFTGRNVHGTVLVRDGGCVDGLDAHGPSRNMGAESTVCALLAVSAMASDARDPIALRRRPA